MKYYIKLNTDNSVNRPYTDANDFEIPDGCIEVSKELVDKYLRYKNKGFVCYYSDGEFSFTHYLLTDEYLCESICKELKLLLTKTDTTQLLDNRLSDVKVAEFAQFRVEVRALITKVLNKEITPSDVVIPEVPSYE